jgi:FkbM family methyltransferase
MKKIKPLGLLSFIAILIISSGCSEEKHPFLKSMEETREKIRNAPGRTGILTEKKLYSCFDEELIIRDFFKDRKDGFFVDVGCAWPAKDSNTYYMEKHLGWTGIGIDALNDYAAGWKEKRPNSKFFNFLVTENSDGTGTFYKSEELGISSTDQKKADGRYYSASLKTEKIQVPKITLNDLLDREGIEKIDLLSMDIEGNELEALAGLDLERFSPALIVTESFGIKDEVLKYLVQHGYQQIKRYEPFDEVNMYFCRKHEPLAVPGK